MICRPSYYDMQCYSVGEVCYNSGPASDDDDDDDDGDDEGDEEGEAPPAPPSPLIDCACAAYGNGVSADTKHTLSHLCVKEEAEDDGGTDQEDATRLCQPSYYNQECDNGYVYCQNEDFDEDNAIEPRRCENVLTTKKCERKAGKGKCHKKKMRKKCQKTCKPFVGSIDCLLV